MDCCVFVLFFFPGKGVLWGFKSYCNGPQGKSLFISFLKGIYFGGSSEFSGVQLEAQGPGFVGIARERQRGDSRTCKALQNDLPPSHCPFLIYRRFYCLAYSAVRIFLTGIRERGQLASQRTDPEKHGSGCLRTTQQKLGSKQKSNWFGRATLDILCSDTVAQRTTSPGAQSGQLALQL